MRAVGSRLWGWGNIHVMVISGYGKPFWSGKFEYLWIREFASQNICCRHRDSELVGYDPNHPNGDM